jgi:hypothetical protein
VVKNAWVYTSNAPYVPIYCICLIKHQAPFSYVSHAGFFQIRQRGLRIWNTRQKDGRIYIHTYIHTTTLYTECGASHIFFVLRKKRLEWLNKIESHTSTQTNRQTYKIKQLHWKFILNIYSVAVSERYIMWWDFRFSRRRCEDDCLLGCCAVLSGRSLQTFQICLLQALLKRRYTTRLHGAISQKTVIFGTKFGGTQIPTQFVLRFCNQL